MRKDKITKTTLSTDDYKIIKDDIEFEIRYHMEANNPAHLDVCVDNILNRCAIYSEEQAKICEKTTIETLLNFEIEKFRERAHDEENQDFAMGDFKTLELLLNVSSELALRGQRMKKLEDLNARLIEELQARVAVVRGLTT